MSPTETLLRDVRTDPFPVTGEFPPLFALVAAHGGSGAGTLARLWAPAVDSEGAWPANSATTQRVVIVAREHMAGVAAAAALLRAAEAGLVPEGVRVHGLVTVAARTGRPDRSVQRYARTVAEMVQLYRIEWCEPLIPLLPAQIPSWKPADGLRLTRKGPKGELLTVPSAIAAVGQQICLDLAAAESITFTERTTE